MTLSSRIGFLTVLLLAWYAPPATAESLPITVRVFAFSENGEPLRDASRDQCEEALSGTDQIDFAWDYDLVAGCAFDQVVVQFTGTLTVPEDSFLVVQHDDGASLSLDGIYVLDAWWDTGCAWDSVWVEAGTYEFEMWYYENGGASCAALWYSDEDQESYQAIPPDWYTTTTTSTTTTSTTTTVPETTTTVLDTTTTTEGNTTSLPPEVASTTTLSPPPISEPSTTLGELPSTTSTSTWPPSTTSTTSTILATTSVPTATVPVTTEPPTTIPLDTIPNLDTISVEDARELFESLDELSDSEISELVETLNDAPDEIKNLFQETVNVFSGEFDQYVPTGSTITVEQRRTIVAASATMTISVLPGSRRRK